MAKVPHQHRRYEFGSLIHDVSRLRSTVIDKALRHLRVTRSQCWVLVHLSNHADAGMMQKELADAMNVGKVALGGLIDRLETIGLVKRQAILSDRRAKHVLMTPRGNRVLLKVLSVARELDLKIMRGVSDSDVARSEKVLALMKQRFLSMEAVPGNRNTSSSR